MENKLAKTIQKVGEILTGSADTIFLVVGKNLEDRVVISALLHGKLGDLIEILYKSYRDQPQSFGVIIDETLSMSRFYNSEELEESEKGKKSLERLSEILKGIIKPSEDHDLNDCRNCPSEDCPIRKAPYLDSPTSETVPITGKK